VLNVSLSEAGTVVARPVDTIAPGWLRKQTLDCRNLGPVYLDKLTPITIFSKAG